MDNDMLYWYTAGALIFVMMFANTYVNRCDKAHRLSSGDYAYIVFLGLVWPFLLTAMAGAVLGAVLGSWKKKSEAKGRVK